MSLKFLVNHGANSASSFALRSGTTASGYALYDLMAGPRSSLWRSAASSALTNLLADGSDFSTASWSKDHCSATATTITADNTTNRHNVRQSDGSVSAGAKYQFICEVKYTNSRYIWIGDGGDADWHGGVLDLQTGIFTDNTFVDQVSAVLLPDGYYRVRVQWTRTNSGGTQELYIAIQNANTAAAPASYLAAGTETVKARNCFFSVWTSGAISLAYNFGSDVACTYAVVARADLMVSQSGATVRAYQKSSGGSWTKITGAEVKHLRSSDLIGPTSQDLVLDLSAAANYRGVALEFDSFLTNAEAAMCSKFYACIAFDFSETPDPAGVQSTDIPDAGRFFTPPRGTFAYETEKSITFSLPPVTKSLAEQFKALPQLSRWPVFLYDTAGDIWPWKLEHIVIEDFEETIIENDKHVFRFLVRRLKHYQ